MGKQVAAGIIWGCSSVGRAPALQAGGQEFESLHLHCTSMRSTSAACTSTAHKRCALHLESEAFSVACRHAIHTKS